MQQPLLDGLDAQSIMQTMQLGAAQAVLAVKLVDKCKRCFMRENVAISD